MFFSDESKKEYFIKLNKFLLEEENKNLVILPKKEDWYKAFVLTPFDETKVVILGQDPYPNKIDAMGLAFSSLNSKTPKSLYNIKLELESDLNIKCSFSNDLSSWAKQGILLLNTILTTIEGVMNAHKNIGWEVFTLNYIKLLNELKFNLVFILWGNNAIKYEKYIDINKHLVLKSAHASPLSAYRGFFGSKPFSKTNTYLISKNIEPIDWSI